MIRVIGRVAAVLVLVDVASAASIWLATGDGTMNGEMTIAVGGTGLIELWVNFPDAASTSPPSEGINGMAVMARMDAILRGAPAGGAVGDPLNIGFAGAINQPLPGGMTLVTRGSTPSPFQSGDLYDYQLLLVAASDPPWMDPANQGWVADNPATAKLDVLVIEGLTVTTGPDTLGFGAFRFAPEWQEMYIDNGVGSGIIDHTFSRLSQPKNGVAVNVTPEPASLALLALGGLAAIRRRH
ncbi:MAG: PEP-CTERM sorting domain-containing protein [Planctomycetota bacterium]|jgi:MYXO-CTERM domain-containing protein